MSWLLIAALAPAFHAASNLVDNHLVASRFRSPWALAFFSSCLAVLVIPIVLLVETPHIPPIRLLPALMAIAVIEILYLVPYYKALDSGETSTVAALFSVGKVLVPVLAYYVSHERLTMSQYLGFGIVVVAGAIAAYEPTNRLKFNKSLWYMLVVSLLLAMETVLLKFVIDGAGWATGLVIPIGLQGVLSLGMLVIPMTRLEIANQFGAFRRSYATISASIVLTVLGTSAASYAISLKPVSFQNAVDSIQPFFVLVFIACLSRKLPNLSREDMSRTAVIRKVTSFLAIVLGIGMVVR